MAETCIWCGHELVDETTNDDLFACGSSHRFSSDTWSQSKGCMEIMQSRRRIQRAVEVLEGANQIMMTLDDDEDVSFVVESQTVSHAIEILEGEEDDESD